MYRGELILCENCRYTDTPQDPYGAHEGFWHTHLGWMLVRPVNKRGTADATDLRKNALVWWQHKHFIQIALMSGVVIPTWVAGYFWGDWRGGVFYACFARLFFVHHVRSSISCISLLVSLRFKCRSACSA
jgi:stearoyl-CoA desaturase (delta-9 desaturase)